MFWFHFKDFCARIILCVSEQEVLIMQRDPIEVIELNGLNRAVLSINEAAQLLGISVRQIYNLRDMGHLTFLKIGRRTKIPVREIRKVSEKGIAIT
jgi:excisionase family DNA binding protein